MIKDYIAHFVKIFKNKVSLFKISIIALILTILSISCLVLYAIVHSALTKLSIATITSLGLQSLIIFAGFWILTILANILLILPEMLHPKN